MSPSPGKLAVLLVTTLLLAGRPAPSSAELLRLRSGEALDARITGYLPDAFRLEDGRTVPRAEVLEVVFQTGEAADDSARSAGGGAPDPAPDKASRVPDTVRAWEAVAARLEERWPGYPALLVSNECEYRLRPDGTRTVRIHTVIKVTKDAGIAYGAGSVGFDPTRSRVHLGRCRTVLPDGRVLPLDPGKVRIQDQRSSSRHLTNQKLQAWRLDGVQTGAFVEQEYELEEFDPFEPRFFFPRFSFRSRLPQGTARLVVRMPSGKALHHVVRNGDDAQLGFAALDEPGGGRRYSWFLDEVAPYVPEPRMPGVGDLVPTVYASSLPDWDEFFAWARGNLERKIAVTPALEARTREVVGDRTDPEEQVAAIYRFLQREIRYVSVKSGIGSGWTGHPAAETLANGYGDCVDKSVLFCAMLKPLGIRAEPLTLMTNRVHDMEIRLPAFDANHCITRVELPGEEAGEVRRIVLDSTSSNYRYPYFRDDDHGQPAASPLADELLRVPVPPPEQNRTERVFELRLDPRGDLWMQERWRGNGSFEARERGFFKRQKQQDFEKVFRDYYAREFSGCRLLGVEVGDADDLTSPFGYAASLTAARHAERAGPLMIVALPFFEQSFQEVSLERRRFPIDYRTSSERVVRWELTLPEGFRVKAAPTEVRLASDWASFALETREEPGRLVVERTFRIHDPWVPAESYPEHRAMLERLEALGKEQVFLEEAP